MQCDNVCVRMLLAQVAAHTRYLSYTSVILHLHPDHIPPREHMTVYLNNQLRHNNQGTHGSATHKIAHAHTPL